MSALPIPALTLEEAQQRVLALVVPTPEQEVPVAEAVGRFLARDLDARRTQPPADLSAMDGFAIRGDGPWRIVGESRAGTPFAGQVAEGEAVRISTGAHMPDGADRVLIRENAEDEGIALRCTADLPEPGQHVRRRGFDFARGTVVLPAGTRIDAAQLALAIAAGHGTLPVRRAPRVTVLDSGDELGADPAACGDDRIPASNGAMIAAMLAGLGCAVTRIGPVPDDRAALSAALAQAGDAEILVTTGGASVGDHDLIRPALEEWGAKLDFWKVAIKPGKPIMLATRGNQVIFGLPGNPVASYVTAFHFILPFIRAVMGASDVLPGQAMLVTAETLAAGGPRREFLRGRWDGTRVELCDSQDSSALVALASGNCLIDRPAHCPQAPAGSTIAAFLLENGGIA